jgi:nucleoside-diphosphate-sugar epimerase
MTLLKSERNVVFGTGPLGLAVMDILVARGRQVTLVNRAGRVGETVPEEVRLVRGDATDPDQVSNICKDADVVFHCAQPPYHLWPERFPPITQGIMEGVSRTNARLVFADNLYMYGPVEGETIHEELPYAATGPKGKTRAQMAQMLLNAHQAGQLQVTIGRASDFFGPRVLGSVIGETFFDPALSGKTVNVIGNPDMPHTYTYIRDFARSLVTLSENQEAYGRAWHVPNAPAMTTRHFADLVAREIDQPVKLRPAGRLTMTLLGLFVPELREMKELMYEFEDPFIVNHSDFEATFGNGVTQHQEAISETITWYQHRSSN